MSDNKDYTQSVYKHGLNTFQLFEMQQDCLKAGIRGPYKVVRLDTKEWAMMPLVDYVKDLRTERMKVSKTEILNDGEKRGLVSGV
jgi:hypothetical protein